MTLGAEGGRRGGRFAARVVCVWGRGRTCCVNCMATCITKFTHKLASLATSPGLVSLVFVRVSRVRVAVRVNFRPSFAPIYVKRRLEHLVSFGPGLWAINLVLTSTWRPQIFASSWSCLKDSVSFNISLTNWR